jgi:DNA-binding transcriptional regulator YdaS (Cro superfamily)
VDKSRSTATVCRSAIWLAYGRGPRELHGHLAATAERPVERTASRWLGEAEAIAGDVVHGDLAPEVRRERLEKVERLLGNVDGTSDDAADHVDEARALVGALLGGA